MEIKWNQFVFVSKSREREALNGQFWIQFDDKRNELNTISFETAEQRNRDDRKHKGTGNDDDDDEKIECKNIQQNLFYGLRKAHTI